MINGVHAIVFSGQAGQLREFFADVLGLESVDAGGGWPIFALPPAELAVHPGGETRHELYLMCDDIHATVEQLRAKGVEISDSLRVERWGIVTSIRLPGDVELGLYEPRHPTPPH